MLQDITEECWSAERPSAISASGPESHSVHDTWHWCFITLSRNGYGMTYCHILMNYRILTFPWKGHQIGSFFNVWDFVFWVQDLVHRKFTVAQEQFHTHIWRDLNLQGFWPWNKASEKLFYLQISTHREGIFCWKLKISFIFLQLSNAANVSNKLKIKHTTTWQKETANMIWLIMNILKLSIFHPALQDFYGLFAVCYCHSVVVLDKNCGSKLTANMISKVPYIYVAGTPCKNFWNLILCLKRIKFVLNEELV